MVANVGTLVSATVDTPDSADTFATHRALKGQGGQMQVPTLAARNSIPSARRMKGMVVTVHSDATGTNNTDWVYNGADGTADDTQWGDKLAAAPVSTAQQSALNPKITHLATLAALQAYSQTAYPVYCRSRTTAGDGYAGTFEWMAGDQSAHVSLDTTHGVYVPPSTDTTGASGAWKRNYSGRAELPWWGAVSGGADASAAIQAAINVVQSTNGHLYVPPLTYGILSTVSITQAMYIEGAGFWDGGSRFIAVAGLNGPMFRMATKVVMIGFSLHGQNNTAMTGEVLVYIENSAGVELRFMSFYGAYDSILIGGSQPVYYLNLTGCTFDTAANSHIVLFNSSAAGVDMIMSDCRFVGAMGHTCWDFSEGLGSMLATNVQISVTGTGPNGPLFYVGALASGFGGAQLTNCVFETANTTQAAVYLAGSSANPVKQFWFINCELTAGAGHALELGNVHDICFIGGGFASSNTDCVVFYDGSGATMSGLLFDGNAWNYANSTAIHKSAGSNTIDVTFKDPRYFGVAPFADFSSNDATKLKLGAIGNNFGLATTPILLGDAYNTIGFMSVAGQGLGNLHPARYVGTTDAAGNAIINSGVTDIDKKLFLCSVFYKESGGALKQGKLNFVDGSANSPPNQIIIISDSGAGAVGSVSYRVGILYTETADPNW